jgi:hypothetical protein
MVFSPVETPELHAFSRDSNKNSHKSSSLKNYGKIKQKHTGVFSSQENINKKFISRNDPYQNDLSDKAVIRTSSEKRVNNNSKNLIIKLETIYRLTASKTIILIL